MKLNQRIRDAEAKARREAREECERRGHHRWDCRFGRRVSGGGGRVHGFCGGPEIPEPEYEETWSHHQRKCVDCGEAEVSDKNGAEWHYDEGRGHFECDPRSGKLYWVDKDGQKKEWNEFMSF